MYVRELQVRYRLRRVDGGLTLPDRLLTSHDAAVAFTQLLKDEPVEVCGLFCLSSRNHVLGYHELSRGTTDTTVVHPREVCKVALLANATAIILGHNHPSGDPSPSPQDLQLTHRIRNATEIIGIELFDHVIVATGGYVSLRQLIVSDIPAKEQA